MPQYIPDEFSANMYAIDQERACGRVHSLGPCRQDVEMRLSPERVKMLSDDNAMGLESIIELDRSIEDLQDKLKALKKKRERALELTISLGSALAQYTDARLEALARQGEPRPIVTVLLDGITEGSLHLNSAWLKDRLGEPVIESMRELRKDERDAIDQMQRPRATQLTFTPAAAEIEPISPAAEVDDNPFNPRSL